MNEFNHVCDLFNAATTATKNNTNSFCRSGVYMEYLDVFNYLHVKRVPRAVKLNVTHVPKYFIRLIYVSIIHKVLKMNFNFLRQQISMDFLKNENTMIPGSF